MRLKYRSRLGNEIIRDVVANGRNWFCTLERPRIELWVNICNDVFLVAGDAQWLSRQEKWSDNALHYYVPPKAIGSHAQVLFESYDESLDHLSLIPFVEPPYERLDIPEKAEQTISQMVPANYG